MGTKKQEQQRLNNILDNIKNALDRCKSAEEFMSLYKEVLPETKHGRLAKGDDTAWLGEEVRNIQKVFESGAYVPSTEEFQIILNIYFWLNNATETLTEAQYEQYANTLMSLKTRLP